MKTQETTRDMKQNFIWLLTSLMLIGLLGLAEMSLAAGDIWTKKADMPTARRLPGTSEVNGIIYVIGGFSDDLYKSFPTVEAYNPVTDTWTKKADMPTARAYLATSVVNGIIYAFGGWDGTADYLMTVEAYDPAKDTWTTKAEMPTARWRVSTSVVNGKIYVSDGCHVIGTPMVLPIVEEYDPATDTWTTKAEMPTARHILSTSVVNGKIYALGGQPAAFEKPILSTVEMYDPETDTWTKKADMPTARHILSTSAVNGKIYAIGGGSAWAVPPEVASSAVEEYDPATDTWTKKADMPTARTALSTSAVNGKIYAIGGGATWAVPLEEGVVEEYTPEGWPFTAVSPQGKLATTWGEIKR